MVSTLVMFVRVVATVMFSQLNQRSVQLGHTVELLEPLANQLVPIARPDSFAMIPGLLSRLKLAQLVISVRLESVLLPKRRFVNPVISAAAQTQRLNLALGGSTPIRVVV